MAGDLSAPFIIAEESVQLGNSVTATQNLVVTVNKNGTFTVARGNTGATTQDLLTIDATGAVSFPAGVTTVKTIATEVFANTLKDVSGNTAIDISKISSAVSRYTRQIYKQVDAFVYSLTTSWLLGTTHTLTSGFKAGSLIKLFYHIPTRNDSTSWGGVYIEPQININGSGWQSLGSCGHDGGVMVLGSATIGSFNNYILINPAQTVDFSLQVRFYYRTYDGTATVSANEIGNISGTAVLMPTENGTQHFSHLVVEELAIFRGAA